MPLGKSSALGRPHRSVPPFDEVCQNAEQDLGSCEMKRWHVIVIWVLAALAMVGAPFTLWRREPVYQYQGKTLGRWLLEANNGSWPRKSLVPADEAIRQIGTNAFPMVARLLRSHDSALKSKLLALYYKQSFIPIHIRTQYERHSCALAACWALGSEAKPMVPAVAKARWRRWWISSPGRSSGLKGASRFLRKWPPATLDPGDLGGPWRQETRSGPTPARRAARRAGGGRRLRETRRQGAM